MTHQYCDTYATGYVTVDLRALSHNYQYLKTMSDCESGAVIKANAYGLGMKEIHACLKKEKCRNFFVATLQEGIALRQYDADSHIYILNGLFISAERVFIEHNLRPVLKSIQELDVWVALCKQENSMYSAALHIETGIHRFGIPIEQLTETHMYMAVTYISDLLVISHLACGNDILSSYNERQLSLFKSFYELYPRLRYSLANSAGYLLGKPYRFDLARLGLVLFGINPLDDVCDKFSALKSVVSLHCPIMQVKTIRKGEAIGYNSTWVAQKDTSVAIIAAGYADGIALGGSNKASMCIENYPLKILGRVSMDMTVLSLEHVPQKYWRIGELIEVFGSHNRIETYAKDCNSHAYEMLTRLGKRFTVRYNH